MQTDRGSFDRLYATNVYLVREFILSQCDDSHVADRLTAQVFLRAWDLFGATPPHDIPPRRCLLHIARTVIVEHTQGERGPR